MFQAVFYPALILVVLIVVEYKYGRLQKPCHHWLLIVFGFVLMGWGLYVFALLTSGEKRYFWTPAVVLPALYYLFLWMFQNHVIGPRPTSATAGNGADPDSAGPGTRYFGATLRWIANGVAPAVLCVILTESVMLNSKSLAERIYLHSEEFQSMSFLVGVLGLVVVVIACVNGLVDKHHTAVYSALIGMWAAVYWTGKLAVIGNLHTPVLLLLIVIPIGWIGGIVGRNLHFVTDDLFRRTT